MRPLVPVWLGKQVSTRFRGLAALWSLFLIDGMPEIEKPRRST